MTKKIRIALLSAFTVLAIAACAQQEEPVYRSSAAGGTH